MASTKHGQSRTRTYNIWALMLQRCTNPKAANFVSYGGSGVAVCKRWYDFANFFADMGHPPSPQHTLDRKDLKGDYTPENCHWADVETQQNNRSNNVFIEAFGERLTVAQWARKTGLTKDQIAHRVFQMGMPPEQALTAPRMSHNKRAIRQSQPDGSDAQVFGSLADAARWLDPEGFDTAKKALWATLKRGGGRATYAGFCWEYVSQGTHEQCTTSQPRL